MDSNNRSATTQQRNTANNGNSPEISFKEWVYVTDPEQENMADDYEEKDKSNWLDDLPVDKEFSGVGFSYNQVYKDDGYKHEDHVFEDKCFRIKFAEDCYLYGVFDGHCGDKASEFVSQRLPAEITLGQLDQNSTDEVVREVLHQAYQMVENAYFASMDDQIAERTSLQQELMAVYGGSLDSKYKAKLERLRGIDHQLSSGTSALVALILKNRLFVANVGNSRALLCRTEAGRLRVESLNDDHTLENEKEVQRLAKLGLPIEQIRNQTKVGQQLYTRCLGDYSVKGGYKDNEQVRSAISEPVISDPDIEETIELDTKCNFLLLMSDGVYRSLIDATGTEHVNADIAGMVATEFSRQSTLNGVGQAVIDRITRSHHDAFALSDADNPKHKKCAVRDDMTLLIRNFNYKLRSQTPDRGGLTSPPAPIRAISAVSARSNGSDSSSTADSNSSKMTLKDVNPFFAQLAETNRELYDTYDSIDNIDSLADSIKSNTSTTLEIDADGKIEPYVSFDTLTKALEAMGVEERQKFEKLLMPKKDCETIFEQPESPNA